MKTKAFFIGIVLAGATAFAQQQIPTGESKETWIKNNPDLYREMGGYIPPSDSENKKAAPVARNAAAEIPSVPTYKDTGNPEVDQKNYTLELENWKAKMIAANESNGVYLQSQEEKAAWIENNPTHYFFK